MLFSTSRASRGADITKERTNDKRLRRSTIPTAITADGNSSTTRHSQEACGSQKRYPPVNHPAEQPKLVAPKLVAPKPVSLGDIPFSTIEAVDTLVGGRHESLKEQRDCTNEKGSFQDWELALQRQRRRSADKFSMEVRSDDGGLKHHAHRHVKAARRSQVNELDYHCQMQSNHSGEAIRSAELSADRQSMAMDHSDEEYCGARPSEAKHSWLPSTFLRSLSRDRSSDIGTTSILTFSKNSSRSRFERSTHHHHRWYERRDAHRGMDVSPKPIPMKMVFFDGGPGDACSSSDGAENGIEDDCVPHKSLGAGQWSCAKENDTVVKVGEDPNVEASGMSSEGHKHAADSMPNESLARQMTCEHDAVSAEEHTISRPEERDDQEGEIEDSNDLRDKDKTTRPSNSHFRVTIAGRLRAIVGLNV